MTRHLVALAAFFVVLPLSAHPTRQELLAEPRYADEDANPVYRKVGAAAGFRSSNDSSVTRSSMAFRW